MLIINALETFIFRQRQVVISLFVLLTLVLFYSAAQLKLDAGFEKNIPLAHPYMQTYLQHRSDFDGANSLYVSVCDNSGNILNPVFFKRLKAVHDELFFLNGVNRSQVVSLYSPATRFTEIVEGGFAGGPVIPADFNVDQQSDIDQVAINIEKAGIIGRQVANDFSCAMVTAQLLSIDPESGQALDTLALGQAVEDQIRTQYADENISIHIIGFSKMIADVAAGAKDVVLFFVIALIITSILVYLFIRSAILTFIPIVCSVIAVVWQLGLLTQLGFGLDPMSILVPFLVFAIGVSHGVQMINAVKQNVANGDTAYHSSRLAFRNLLIPGGIALLSDSVGFFTLLVIDIGIIQELAITASLGVAVIIFTNLILLPVLMSYLKLSPTPNSANTFTQFWAWCCQVTDIPRAKRISSISALVMVLAALQASQLKIGDLHAGAPALHADSQYNIDTALITDRYAITVDYISVLVEADEAACTDHRLMSAIDEFQWRMENIDGVQSAVSLASVAKKINAGYNEGNVKWHSLPRTRETLVQAVGRVPSSTGLLNRDCSVMPVIIFLENHKAETIETVVDAIKASRQAYQALPLNFALASGPVGVMAATNEAVAEAQTPMLLYVFGVVTILCLITFRSWQATLAVILPLYLVSLLAQSLMTILEIGLTVSTLPVIALGVGIGVDYGIYILSAMIVALKQGKTVSVAYLQALHERGSAVIFTAVTLAIGVSTWVFSALKFQMDMGILLTFMFLVNMLAAVVILPALAALFWRYRR